MSIYQSYTFLKYIKNCKFWQKLICTRWIQVYSQNEEDGIIESIFRDIGIKNKIFCEIGIGNTIENNTHNLLNNWQGLWIDINANYINKFQKKIISNKKN